MLAGFISALIAIGIWYAWSKLSRTGRYAILGAFALAAFGIYLLGLRHDAMVIEREYANMVELCTVRAPWNSACKDWKPRPSSP